MDTHKTQFGEEVVTFDLFNDNFELAEDVTNTEGVLNLGNEIDDLLSGLNTEESNENDTDFQDFVSQQTNLRFQPVTSMDLDQLEAENEAKSTHWQTTWAVKILKGNF